jgi:hypothetical protein
MASQFFINHRPHEGLTYWQYFERIQKKVDKLNPLNFSSEEKVIFEKDRINFLRMNRIHKTFNPDEHLISRMNNIDEPQLWMVLTEDWCGDSAQNLPYIYEFSKLNPLIDLRILERDKNLDIMDEYLSETKTRSIPKLVAFDEKGTELFQWGSRPKEAQELVDKLKAEGKSKDEFLERLHLWYGRNRGKVIEQEFINLLDKITEPSHT